MVLVQDQGMEYYQRNLPDKDFQAAHIRARYAEQHVRPLR